MTDTTIEIKNLQRKIWLSKSPTKRLEQFMTDNEALFKFYQEIKTKNNSLTTIKNTSNHGN